MHDYLNVELKIHKCLSEKTHYFRCSLDVSHQRTETIFIVKFNVFIIVFTRAGTPPHTVILLHPVNKYICTL